MKDYALRRSSERGSPPLVRVGPSGVLGDSVGTSLASSFDNILPTDPYAELESQNERYLSTDVLSCVKRSSSYTQVSSDQRFLIQPTFVQRRHSLTSISGKGSPIEEKKQQRSQPMKTPWPKLMRNFIGNKHEPVKKKSLPAPLKKPSLIELAREEDPFMGIWMGPPEKLVTPEPVKNPRSKSFEVPSSKVNKDVCNL